MPPILSWRIFILPQEIKDKIFFELLKIYLLVGKIFLNSAGLLSKKYMAEASVMFKYHHDADKYAQPDVSIFSVLNIYWTKHAKHLLYGCNTFVLPPNDLGYDLMNLFEHWNPRAQKLIKSVEVRLSMRDFTDLAEMPHLAPLWRKWILSAWKRTFSGLRDLQPHTLLIDCRVLAPEFPLFVADKLNFSKIFKMVTPAVIQIRADFPEHERRLMRSIKAGARSMNSNRIKKGKMKISVV